MVGGATLWVGCLRYALTAGALATPFSYAHSADGRLYLSSSSCCLTFVDAHVEAPCWVPAAVLLFLASAFISHGLFLWLES